MTEPHGYVLKILYGYGALEGDKLTQREYRETAARQAEILTGRVEIPRTFDTDQARADCRQRHVVARLVLLQKSAALLCANAASTRRSVTPRMRKAPCRFQQGASPEYSLTRGRLLVHI